MCVVKTLLNFTFKNPNAFIKVIGFDKLIDTKYLVSLLKFKPQCGIVPSIKYIVFFL